MSEKKIELTQHAEDMLRERAIETDWVEQTVRNPESVEEDPGRPETRRAFRRIPERDDRVLRVAYVVTEQVVRIVPAFFDRAKRRK